MKSVLHLNLVYLLLKLELFSIDRVAYSASGGGGVGYSCIHFACAELCS